MLTPEDDLELLNNEGQVADESKFSSFFLGPTYKAIKETFWATGTVIICLCIAALIFTYTERKWQIVNSDIGEGEWDVVYIDAEKLREMRRMYDKINEMLNANRSEMETFGNFAGVLCGLKRDVYDYKWHYGGCVDYVISILTTTGWGVNIPDTAGGRFFTIIYFLGGIPIMVLFLHSLVEVIDSVFTTLRACLADRIKNVESNPDGWALYSVSSMLIAILTLLVLIAAGISARREHSWDISGADFVPAWADDGKQNWVYWDAFYYQVISLLTIGFGDFHHRAYDYSFGARQFFFVFLPMCFFLALSKTMVNQFKEKRAQRAQNMAGHQ